MCAWESVCVYTEHFLFSYTFKNCIRSGLAAGSLTSLRPKIHPDLYAMQSNLIWLLNILQSGRLTDEISASEWLKAHQMLLKQMLRERVRPCTPSQKRQRPVTSAEHNRRTLLSHLLAVHITYVAMRCFSHQQWPAASGKCCTSNFHTYETLQACL